MKTLPRFSAPATGAAKILHQPAKPRSIFDHPDIVRELEKTGLRVEAFMFGQPLHTK